MREVTSISGLEFELTEIHPVISGPESYHAHVLALRELKNSLSLYIADVESQKVWSTDAANVTLKLWRRRVHALHMTTKGFCNQIKSISREINS